MRTMLIAVCVACESLALSSSLAAQPFPPFARPAGTYGALLEAEFTKLLVSCEIAGIFEVMVRRGRQKSAIPVALVNELPLKARATPLVGNSTARIMSYVFPAGSATRGDFSDSRWLQVPTDYAPLSMVQDGTSVVAHSHSCVSLVAEAVNANLDLPASIMRAALAASLEAETNASLIVVHGRFYSPFDPLPGIVDTGHRLQDLLASWDWYVRNPDAISAPQEFISRVDGTSLYRAVGSSRGIGGKLDLKGALRAGSVASLEAGLTRSLDLSSQTSVTSHGTILLDSMGGRSLEVRPFPKAQAVVDGIGAYRLSLIQPPSTTIELGLPFTHQQVLKGFPAAMCNELAWTVYSGTQSSAKLSLISVERDTASVCRFTVRYVPAQSDTTNESIVLDYFLQSRERIGSLQARIPATPVVLTSSNEPRVHSLTADPHWEYVPVTVQGVKRDSLVWRVYGQVSDETIRILESSAIAVQQISLTCGQVSQPVVATASWSNAPTRRFVLQIARPLISVEAINPDEPRNSCQTQGALLFTLQDGRKASRGLPSVALELPALRRQ